MARAVVVAALLLVVAFSARAEEKKEELKKVPIPQVVVDYLKDKTPQKIHDDPEAEYIGEFLGETIGPGGDKVRSLPTLYHEIEGKDWKYKPVVTLSSPEGMGTNGFKPVFNVHFIYFRDGKWSDRMVVVKGVENQTYKSLDYWAPHEPGKEGIYEGVYILTPLDQVEPKVEKKD